MNTSWITNLSISTIFILLVSGLNHANANTNTNDYSLSISSKNIGGNAGAIYFGLIDGELPTSFDNEDQHRNIYWKSKEGTVIGQQGYLLESTVIVDKVAFCVDSKCSNYIDIKRKTKRIQRMNSNKASLDVRVLESDKLATGITPISITDFDIIDGNPIFIYQEHLDQNRNILSSKIVYKELSTFLMGKELKSDTKNFQACSIAGFESSEPTYIEACTNIHSINNTIVPKPPITSENIQGCIISLETNEKYCLKIGQRSGYTLPAWINKHQVYVQADEGTHVTLSDWDNLSYNRIANFVGTVENKNLKSVKAANGQNLDFSHPRSMRVGANNTPLGCIRSIDGKNKYCMPKGERSNYILPNWIKGKEVYVDASYGVKVMLSDWANLSYNRIASFVGTVENHALNNIKANTGKYLNFSRPKSMRVLSDNTPLGCIYKKNSNLKYCLPIGQRSGYSLPSWISKKEVDVKVHSNAAVRLSDFDNLSYGHIATFKSNTKNKDLEHVKANNGNYLDFSEPRSMAVLSAD